MYTSMNIMNCFFSMFVCSDHSHHIDHNVGDLVCQDASGELAVIFREVRRGELKSL